MVIIIFGFSGAGKSTLADKLGKSLGLRVVHPSSIVRSLLQRKPVDLIKTEAGINFWESTEGVALFKSRLNEKQPIDLIGDEMLLKELEKGNVVMDSWTMPWLFKGEAVRIFLKAPHEVRMRRVAKRSGVSVRQASRVVRMKDEGTRRMYRRVRGFDMKKNLGVFDIVMNVTSASADEVFRKTLACITYKQKNSLRSS